MNRQRHPAGTSVGGQWAPGSASEVETDIFDAFDGIEPPPPAPPAQPEPPDPYPDRMLAEHLGDLGLSESDLPPGLRQEWNKHFAGAGETPPAEEDICAEHLGINPRYPSDLHYYRHPDGGMTVEISAVSGRMTGSKHFESAEDFGGETLYTYELPPNEGRELAAALRKARQKRQSQWEMLSIRGQKLPPWAIRADGKELDKDLQRHSRLQTDELKDRIWAAGWDDADGSVPQRPAGWRPLAG